MVDPFRVLFLWQLIVQCYAVHLNLIELHPSNHPLTGYRAVAPALDVAFDEISERYPAVLVNATRNILDETGFVACPNQSWETERISRLMSRTWELVKLDALNIIVTPCK